MKTISAFCLFLLHVVCIHSKSVPNKTSTSKCTTPFDGRGEWCYYIEKTPMNYCKAMMTCTSLDSHLAYITSAEEQEEMLEYLFGHHVPTYVWLGGYDLYGNDTMYWLDGKRLDSGYTNYDESEINGGNEDALFVDNDLQWRWGDYSPSTKQAALCERDL